MAERTCSTATNESNADTAESWNYRKYYARVLSVLIHESTPGTPPRATFSIRDASGGQDMYNNVVWGNADEMWVYCPSTLPSPEEGPLRQATQPPPRGAAGVVYIHREYMHGPNTIVALVKPVNKWPRSYDPDETLPAGLKLKVKTLSIVGNDLDTNNFEVVELNLLDRKAVPAQKLKLTTGSVELKTIANGQSKVRTLRPLAVWVTGEPGKPDTNEASVNLLDPQLSDPLQEVDINDSGFIVAQLTEDGLDLFNATQTEVVKKAARGLRTESSSDELRAAAWRTLAKVATILLRGGGSTHESRVREYLAELAGLGLPRREGRTGGDSGS